jgi:hypothetical protein
MIIRGDAAASSSRAATSSIFPTPIKFRNPGPVQKWRLRYPL